MRGTQNWERGKMAFIRIIPADAGNTPRSWSSAGRARDHPRGCGEHLEHGKQPVACSGSSPRMRGTLKRERQLGRPFRIIPADAGNTHGFLFIEPPVEDHPRGCGEHRSACRSWETVCGSSPRMRGTHRATESSSESMRIIPADAGNTCTAYSASSGVKDHPRGCGEH